METNKVEHYIKSKLENREIEPSSKAWETISRELPVVQNSKNKYVFWLGLAASVLVLLSVSFFYLNKAQEVTTQAPAIVENEKEIQSTEATVITNRKNLQPNKNIALPEVVVQQEGVLKKPSLDPKALANVPVKPASLEEISHPNNDEPKHYEAAVAEVSSVAGVDEMMIEKKAQELLASITSKGDLNEISEAEIDALLRKAQEDIIRERAFKNSTAVDAMALLNEVEEELDQSFRDQLFNSLKASFIKVSTAVADRD